MLIIGIKGFSQEKKDSLIFFNLNERNFPVKNKFFNLKANSIKNDIKKSPLNRKIDIFNSNYPNYDYDIFNPNKSDNLINFLLSGISNSF